MTQTVPLTDSQQQLVLACDGHIRHLAWKYARNTHDFKDLYSRGMEAAREALACVSTLDDPVPYLYQSAENAMHNALERNEQKEPNAVRDAFILQSLQEIAPTIKNIAGRSAYECRSTYEYEELYQVAAETALLAYDRAQEVENPRAYLHRAMRLAVLKYIGATRPDTRPHTLADHYFINSLDAPLRPDSECSLSSLVSEEMVTHENIPQAYPRLYAALATLPDIYREVLCMCFGLCGYGVHRNSEIAHILGVKPSVIDNRLWRAKALLREHIERLTQDVHTREEIRASREATYARELVAWNAGNQTCVSLAKALDVSRGTAHDRMKKLAEAGLITIKSVTRNEKGALA